MALYLLTVVTNRNVRAIALQEPYRKMTPEEDNIFGAFLECPLVPLEGVPTYEYMNNLNVYLNSCSSAVNCTLECGTLGYLVLTAQPAVFNTHCVTKFVIPKNPGIRPVMPDPAPTAAILSKLVRTHKHEVRLFNKYHTVTLRVRRSFRNSPPRSSTSTSRAISLVTQRSQRSKSWRTSFPSTPNSKKRIYKKLTGRSKNPFMAKLCSKILFKNWVESRAVAVHNPYSPAHIVSMAYANIDKCGLYQDDCCNWSCKPRSEKTWVKFNTYFAWAFKDTRRSSKTSRTEGYVAHVQSAK